MHSGLGPHEGHSPSDWRETAGCTRLIVFQKDVPFHQFIDKFDFFLIINYVRKVSLNISDSENPVHTQI
jgi:hypothetical protein